MRHDLQIVRTYAAQSADRANLCGTICRSCELMRHNLQIVRTYAARSADPRSCTLTIRIGMRYDTRRADAWPSSQEGSRDHVEIAPRTRADLRHLRSSCILLLPPRVGFRFRLRTRSKAYSKAAPETMT